MRGSELVRERLAPLRRHQLCVDGRYICARDVRGGGEESVWSVKLSTVQLLTPVELMNTKSMQATIHIIQFPTRHNHQSINQPQPLHIASFTLAGSLVCGSGWCTVTWQNWSPPTSTLHL